MAGEKQPSLEVAAAVAETAKKIGGAYVFSSLNKSIVREENASAIIVKQKFAQFACTDCGTEFAALDALEPKCITCGSTTKKGAEKAVSIKDDTELVSITCGACNSLNIMHTDIASTLKGTQHCAACGTELMNLFVKAADEVPMDDEVSVDDLDVVDTDGDGIVEMEAEELNPEDVLESADEDEEDEEKEESEDNFGGKKAPPFEKKETSENEDEDEDKEESTDDSEEKKDDEESDTHCSEGTVPKDAVQEGNGEEVPMEMEAEDVDMVDMIDEDNIDEMALVAMGNTILLAAGKYNVGSLSEEKAGDNKDIFHTKEFQSAIIASLKSDGLRKTMSKFNFDPVIVKAKVKKHVAKMVKAGVEKAAVDLKAKSESMAKDWQQSLDIAATGLNKSFWKNAQNPLKAALIRDLLTLNVRNPDKLVSSIFEKHGLEYSAVLISTAKGLLEKSREMRNELAEVLNMTGILATDDNDDDDDYGDDEETSEPIVGVSEEKASKLRDERRRGSETAGSGGQIRQLGNLFDA